MDIASLLGVILGIGMVLFGIIQNSGVPALLNFLDAPSAIITIGGSLSAVLCSNKLSGFIAGIKSFALPFKEKSVDPGETINKIIELSNVSRKEGLLALEEAAGSIADEFLKKGIMLVVDGTDAELVRGILETDMLSMEERHKKTISFWEFWGEQGPAWGMIGTLIGLINMLKNLEDSSTIGPNMAVALVTTFYGSLIANWLCAPFANKLKANNELELTLKTLIIEGLLSIQAGENPRVIEEKLKSFLSPDKREALSPEGGGEE